MTTTIAEQVSHLAETMTSQPANEVMEAFAREQAELVPELARRGVGLVAVSPQAPDTSLSMAEKNELTFTILSDPGNQLASVAGVLTTLSDHARAAQVKLGLDLSKVNADGNVTLPMATAVVVDGSGVVQWDDVHPDYTTRSEPDEILAALEPLGIR